MGDGGSTPAVVEPHSMHPSSLLPGMLVASATELFEVRDVKKKKRRGERAAVKGVANFYFQKFLPFANTIIIQWKKIYLPCKVIQHRKTTPIQFLATEVQKSQHLKKNKGCNPLSRYTSH